VSDITLYEVSPRDGLQSHSKLIPTPTKIQFIQMLHDAGLTNIEVTSFVNPNVIPNLADAEEVFIGVKHLNPFVLVPNHRGMERAQKVGAENINIFFSADENFNYKNLGMGLEDILIRYEKMLERQPKSKVRVYVSCFFDPLINQDYVINRATALGSKIVLCDTDGKATPEIVHEKLLSLHLDRNLFSAHFHKGKTPMIQNVIAAYNAGIREFDCSIGGLGGCPLYPNSNGNLPTEEIIQWAKERGIDCGVDDVSHILEFMESEIF
jgi:hydroxymethylglutaryl-CoA lyase